MVHFRQLTDSIGRILIDQQTQSPMANEFESEQWLRQQDISNDDDPHIKGMLLDSFREWSADIIDISALRKGTLVLFDAELKSVTYFSTSDIAKNDYYMERDLPVLHAARASQLPQVEVQQDALLVIPLLKRTANEVYALLAYYVSGDQYDMGMTDVLLASAKNFNNIFYSHFERLFVKDLMRVQRETEREFRKKTILFEVVQRIHGKFDVDTILTEVMDSIREMYPTAATVLYISTDFHSTHHNVKPLVLQSMKDGLRLRAFMEGQLHYETTHKDNDEFTRIAAPISGKQGVYGVLHMTVEGRMMEDSDYQLIQVLADTAGTAFENARLFEQSNMLVSELRSINDLTKQLNQSLRLNDIHNLALKQLLHTFKADYSATLRLDASKKFFQVSASNSGLLKQDHFSTTDGFCGLLFATKEPLIIVDYEEMSEVDSIFMTETASRSLMVVPLMVNSEMGGAIFLSHREPNYFSYDDFKLFQVLSTHIGLAISNASLHAKVQRMANHDNLTGLYARHYLNERVNQRQKIDLCGSLIVVDIDHFKRINDKYGHQVGDAILRQVSDVIVSSIRESDVAARWGGEELAIYLPQLSKTQAVSIAERIRRRVEQETTPHVTVSCGISEWNWDDDKISVESLFYKADMALYQAKHGGRNQINVD